ncbi:MAG: site-specific integrase [Xanthobacteraceae bacterium]
MRLPIRPKPYFRRLEIGFHLGYRRLSSCGTWIARRFAQDGCYREFRLGQADDTQDADGVTVLDYGQAQSAARVWRRTELRREEGHDTRTGPLMVGDAVAEYLKAFERRGGKSIYDARRTAETHILPTLGLLEVAKLTAKRIEDWHQSLAENAPRVRSKAGEKPKHREADKSVDGVRKRRATANRILTVLKAALNHTWEAGHVASDDAWRRVRPFKSVETARVRYLSEAEFTRLVNACEPDFRNLVRGALLTGCRYSELARMRVGDFNSDAGVVTIRESKAGKPRHVVLTDEGRQFFGQRMASKLADELICTRADDSPWRKSQQSRPMRDACRHAKIRPAVSFHVLRHTYGSMLAMRGVPMAVIAEQLGHTDTRMTEKHYAHLAPNYVADTIRAHFPKLGIADDSDVIQLQSMRKQTPTRSARSRDHA